MMPLGYCANRFARTCPERGGGNKTVRTPALRSERQADCRGGKRQTHQGHRQTDADVSTPVDQQSLARGGLNHD